jgi:tetratricopeptide (TPR) repeat protein
MRYICFLFLAVVFFSCQSNKKQEDPATTKAANADEAELLKDVAQYPDSVLLLQSLVAYYSKGQNYDAALASIDKSLQRDSMNPYVWDMKSLISGQKGDTTKAIAALEKAIGIYPSPEFIISLGALYAETKNPLAIAMADVLLLSDKVKSEKEAYFIKGLYHSFKKEQEKAIPFFDKCIALNYSFMDAYLEKALSLYDLKKYGESAEVLEKALTINNSFDKGYYYLGQCYEKLNRTQEAIDVYQRALMYDPEYIEVKDALGRLGVK